MPYQSFGARSGTAVVMTAWILSAISRSGCSSSAILSTTARASSSAVGLFVRRERSSLARCFMASRSAALKLSSALAVFAVVRFVVVFVAVVFVAVVFLAAGAIGFLLGFAVLMTL